MLLENQFDQMEHREFTELQWQRGYHMFRHRSNFKAAAKVFTQWALPTEQLVLLFSEMYPGRYIDDLMQLYPDLLKYQK